MLLVACTHLRAPRFRGAFWVWSADSRDWSDIQIAQLHCCANASGITPSLSCLSHQLKPSTSAGETNLKQLLFVVLPCLLRRWLRGLFSCSSRLSFWSICLFRHIRRSRNRSISRLFMISSCMVYRGRMQRNFWHRTTIMLLFRGACRGRLRVRWCWGV